MPYLVQGFLFQENTGLGLAFKPIEGAVVVIETRLTQAMFAGAIWTDRDSATGTLTGKLQDTWGVSALSKIEIVDDRFTFEKLYDRRPDPISYEFHRVGNVWLGKYTGTKTGTGVCQCILTEVEESFFDWQTTMKEFGMDKPYFPPPDPWKTIASK